MVSGLYRHFKGGLYFLKCVARLSEDDKQEVVVYQSIDTGKWWVRPKESWTEQIERDGYKGLRFSPVDGIS